MSTADVLAVLFAGLGAGFVITAVGAGSLVSFPILLGVGLSPVVANVSNTVGLVPGGLSGSWGYRRELAGKAVLVKTVAITSGLGALAGSVLLLVMPADSFETVIPWLILLASTLVGIQPFLSAWLTKHNVVTPTPHGDQPMPLPLSGMSALIGVYGGYFGAGQGVMLVAFLALGLDQTLQVVNALKNVAVVSANVAATLVFVVWAPLDWPVVGLIAAGSVVGGWLGAVVGRRLPPLLFRILVVGFGYVVAVRLLMT